ncbi:hypothetical protein [Pelomonas sp. Root1217]|nr:hypothetical protein [Pelomonas sp. Root1217]
MFITASRLMLRRAAVIAHPAGALTLHVDGCGGEKENTAWGAVLVR